MRAGAPRLAEVRTSQVTVDTAAQGACLGGLLLLASNRKDLQDVPPSTCETLKFIWLDTVNDAIAAALGGRERERRTGGALEFV